VRLPVDRLKIRILLADDHAVIREGLARLLADQPDMEVVGQATHGQEAVELASKLLPSVILMDVNMPVLNGIQATRAIHQQYPDIRIIGLSMFKETEQAQAMSEAGAVQYLCKSGASTELIKVIRGH
jgi:DNA-binding NarL/FixJ family response regulator